jgi:hypothetical protein
LPFAQYSSKYFSTTDLFLSKSDMMKSSEVAGIKDILDCILTVQTVFERDSQQLSNFASVFFLQKLRLQRSVSVAVSKIYVF